MEQETHGGYRLYWKTWGILLVLTLVMLVVEVLHLPRLLMVLALVAFMLVKAAMIAGNFMHLRFEHWTLVATVALGLLLTGTIMFALMAPDGLRILALIGSS